MHYKIGEEVIMHYLAHDPIFYLKKGKVTEVSPAGSVRVIFNEDLRGPETYGWFYPEYLANSKEFFQLQLEGKIE